MSPIALSERALNTPASPIRRLAPLALEAKARGLSIHHLNIGQPDIESPPEFLEGLKRFKQKVIAYESSLGNERLRIAWSNYLNRTLGLSTTNEEFLITTGASEALIFLFMTVCDPGDEIIIIDPTYANYIGFAAIAGVKLVPVLSSLEENFSLPSSDTIAKCITPRTKAILLCSPNNPTGTVYTREELSRLLELCNERNLFFIIDETYREIVFDGREPFSVLHLEAKNPRVIIVDSLSKRFSLCGARLGCLLTCNAEVMRTCVNVAQARLAAPTIEQFAAAHMLEKISDSYVSQLRLTMQTRRDVLFDALSKIPGVTAQKPQGAFYMIARLPVPNAEAFATFMLSTFSKGNATTFVAPAAGFYMQQGQGLSKIRLAYVLETEQLVQAIDILGSGLTAFREQ